MKRKVFLSGVLTNAAVTSLIQDMHGKEGYINRIQNGWISAGITVPIALIMLVFAYSMYVSRKEN